MNATEQKKMCVALASDHGGFDLKKTVREHLEAAGYTTEDFGTYTAESCDYPDFAVRACDAVVEGRCDRAVLCCGTGIGMSIAANKVKGIRAAVVTEPFSTEFTRRHNDANVLCLGQRVLSPDTALKLVDIFMTTPFDGGRHVTRLDKIAAIEKR